MPPPTHSTGARLTYDDFLLFPDDGKRHEIIDGEHFVTASPNLRHQELVGRLYLAIGNYLSRVPGVGRVFLSPLDVVLSYYDVVEPDLLFVAGDQLDILTPKNVQGAPALVVEVLSDSTRGRDLTLKRRLFERASVREYWVVDPDAETVRVFRVSQPDELSLAVELSADAADVVTTSLLPGFELSLAVLFAVT